MEIRIPELALVVLVGASGAGKSSLARRLFRPTEILSSDVCRGWVSDDENAQDATHDAFEVLRFIAARRLARGLLTVIDATNVRSEDRRPLVHLAREHHALPVAIVLDTPERVCIERNLSRADRAFGPHVVRNQRLALRRDARNLEREGFKRVVWIRSPEELAAATLIREPLWNNLRHEHGPFDIIGDVHGCLTELVELLHALGWRRGDAGPDDWSHPERRRLIFVGDLVDRGPDTPGVLRLVMGLVSRGRALCVPGNHDIKLVRALRGRNVKVAHGLERSLAQLAGETPEFRREAADFLDDLVSHYVLDGGRLVVAHAGMKESMQGRGSGAVREFALYGETTGETDEFGLPVRLNWAAEYRGKAAVVYGHTPVPRAEWLNNTIDIDTGCVFGGSLTALRWPERELASVKAHAEYAESRKPFLPAPEQPVAERTLQQAHDDVLDLGDIAGKRRIETRLAGGVTIRETNAAAAMEVMSRFAVDPRWLIYLPPTMSPCETSGRPGLLEHPAEAFEHFRAAGVRRVICEEKHMGSRAVVVLGRDAGVVRARFGVDGEAAERAGVVYTRTGRAFFEDASLEQALLERVRAAATDAGLWAELSTDWLCLDCELMPWSAKAQALLREQYAPVAAAAGMALPEAVAALVSAAERVPAAAGLLEATRARAEAVSRYARAYQPYCWTVGLVDDLRLAPFHLLASEGRVHTERDHLWHMDVSARLAEAGGSVLIGTRHRVVDLDEAESEAAAAAWWEELVGAGGEGMVVKPLEFVARDAASGRLTQPGVKVRGPEYLRIIYGPEYSLPANLERLRSRGLSSKRALALREFALGVEALERFVAREPLRRVHECVFGVLALESEPVDPRL